jgi:sugar lactone lactonase YvrE
MIMKHLSSSSPAPVGLSLLTGWHRILALSLAAVGLAGGVFAQSLTVTTFVGQADTRGSADGTGTAARFFGPSGIVADGAGGFYVADALNNTIRRISAGGVVTTVAGGNINEITNLPDRGYADGTGRDALFSTGYAVTAGADGPIIAANYGTLTMARDSSGNLYMADTLNHVIRKISSSGVVTTLAGSAGNSGSANATGSAAQFSSPFGVGVDSSGNVYVADAGNNLIRKITSAGVVTTVAGKDGSNAGNTDGAGADARFNNPTGLVSDGAGTLYVADTNNQTIRKITSGGTVTTYAGRAGEKGSSDGLATVASFNNPSGLTLDSAGNLYVVDTGNSTIRKITTNGIVSTVAGLPGSAGSADGTGNAARLTTPYGVAVDGSGNVYIADSGNNVIRKGVVASAGNLAIQTQPKAQYVHVNETAVFSVTATGTPAPTYQWRRGTTDILGATTASYSIASAQFSNEGVYSVLVTSGTTSITSSGAKLVVVPTLTEIPAIVIVTQPGEQNVTVGQSATFAVEVAGSANPTYQWQKDLVDITGATNSVYSIASAQLSDIGTYRVVIKAGSNTQNSISVPLNVTTAVTPPPPPPSTGRIINLSILTSVAGGTDNFTMGYVVGGSGTSGSKPLVIRAAGPALGLLGVGGTLDDPKFELYAGSTKTTENDNWGGSAQLSAAMTAVGAFPYTVATSKDAAATASISSRDNSVVVSAASGNAGLVIAEIYDATPSESFVATTPRLINVSVRKSIGSGLTAGFVLGGSAATKVLIRVVGPTLGDFGVPGVVADPKLTLFNGSSVKIDENDNWGGTAALSAAFTSVGAFGLPAGSKDAAIVTTLNPGNYSVQAAGVNNTTGVVLVEVYEVP